MSIRGRGLRWLAVTLAGAVCAAAPLLAQEDSVFLREGGCVAREGGAAFECPEGSPLAALGCDRGRPRPDLAALTPPAPLASCVEIAYGGTQHGDYLQGPQGLQRTYGRLFVAEGGGFRALGSAAALAGRFAPIESAEEALAFARAVTGLAELRGFERDDRFRYYLDDIADTAVTAEADGYLVRNLRHDQVFGCGPHPTSLVTVRVTPDGVVDEISRQRAFEDPSRDALCVD